MIQATVEEMKIAIASHQRRETAWTPRKLLRESDELMYWLEECIVQRVMVVPGWLMPRVAFVMSHASPKLATLLLRERRPEQVMDILYRGQAQLMDKSILAKQPARIIQLFR